MVPGEKRFRVWQLFKTLKHKSKMSPLVDQWICLCLGICGPGPKPCRWPKTRKFVVMHEQRCSSQ